MKKISTLLFLTAYLVLGGSFTLNAQDYKIFFDEGEAERKNKNYAQAIGEFESALLLAKLPEAKSEIYYSKGLCHIGLKQDEKAIESMKEVIKLTPSNKMAYNQLIRIYRTKQQLPKVITTMDALANSEEDIQAKAKGKVSIVELLYQERIYSKALTYAKEAYNLDASNLGAIYYVAVLSNKLDQYTEAVNILTTEESKYSSLSQDANAPYYYELGYALFACEKFEEAYTAFQKANFGQFKPKIAQFQPDHFVAVANTYMALYQLGEAERLLNMVLKIDPTHANANLKMAEVQLAKKNDQNTIKLYEQALTNASAGEAFASVFHQFYTASFAINENDKALTFAQKAIDLNIAGIDGLIAKSYALSKQKNEEALKLLEMALTAERMPMSEEGRIRLALAEYYIGVNNNKAMDHLKNVRFSAYRGTVSYMMDKVEKAMGEKTL
ncbi:tetratricopeptide repeat protein [Algivirga pacifica]|uniref:Tetratricopeptide repeat-containing protein n=1 Tax=Algivirga pacifica TaxID=1162670 RepID=A0ABP9D8A8_9BACT